MSIWDGGAKRAAVVGREGKEEEVSGVRWDEIGSVVERDGTGLGLGRGRGRWSRMGWDGRVCGRKGRGRD